jgi:hypothetical protein
MRRHESGPGVADQGGKRFVAKIIALKNVLVGHVGAFEDIDDVLVLPTPAPH